MTIVNQSFRRYILQKLDKYDQKIYLLEDRREKLESATKAAIKGTSFDMISDIVESVVITV